MTNSLCLCIFVMFNVQGDQLSGKPGNVREFDSCQSNVRKNLFRNNNLQGGHKPGKLADFSEHGKRREFSGNSVQPRKNCNKQSIFS